MSDVFDQLADAHAQGGLSAALVAAETRFRGEDRYHELFEILKMKSRLALGLSIVPGDTESLPESAQRDLEVGLLDACKEVGFALLHQGKIQDSWFYLRHLHDRDAVREALGEAELNEENLEQHVALLLHEGLDIEQGFALVLKHHGTCNAITTMQNALYGRSKSERQAAGRLLVAHVHQELRDSVRAHIEREEGQAVEGDRLQALAEGRDYLFADGSYHIDTSHLSATVQVAGELTDRPSLELAQDLAWYGAQLDETLQYASDPPFEDTYPSYARFFSAQLGDGVDEHVAFFQQRAEATDAYQEGTFAIETYVDLLARLGRADQALEVLVQLIPAGIQQTGRAPSLYELSEQLGDFRRYREICQQREDTLGYLIALGK